jgi:uncharacterized protein YjbJ (UPF0337 family)
MNQSHNKLSTLWAGIILTLCSVGAYAAESKNDTPVNKDQVEGRVEETKGKVKEVTGKIIDDKGMEVEGNVQKNLGKAQKGYGDLKQDIKEGK